ncbi:MAG: hypothetical protein HY301_14220 [Verrucomicrobia bacterium]|nr:hypothetical protein [Verrucomicrobiota bacterium]
MQKYYVHLSPSEQAVLSASAQILSGFIAAGQYSEARDQELRDKSFQLAIALAEHVEKVVAGEDEMP